MIIEKTLKVGSPKIENFLRVRDDTETVCILQTEDWWGYKCAVCRSDLQGFDSPSISLNIICFEQHNSLLMLVCIFTYGASMVGFQT